ncbi:MAG: tyrosine-type recombinase/integrase [Bacteroidia bacterium]|nr:tyrosine-type recombinase/integrase [Bacteroidia bacterium]
MSQKHTYTTADYITWDTATNLVRKLYRNGDYRMSLFIGSGIFFGLRVSDLLTLSWNQILGGDEFVIYEKKTDKRRVIRINEGFKAHIADCFQSLEIKDANEPCFLNRYGSVLSLQMVNRNFKAIKVKYQLKIENFSTHSLRKTWARQVYENENSQGRGDMALLKLSEIMNHSCPSITRRYIGLRQQELGQVYESLQF